MKQNPETKKKSMGRRKIEIKTIQNKNNLLVTFCKRRSGLFKKAGELGLLTGAQIAIILQSPTDKVFAFSNVNMDPVLKSFQTGTSSSFEPESRTIWKSRKEYVEAERRLWTEEKRTNELDGPEMENWWDKPVEGFRELYELEEYLKALEGLKGKVLERVGEFEELRLVEDIELDFEVGESSSNLSGFGDGKVCGYGDWQGRFSGHELFDQEGELIPFEDLKMENIHTDACGSSSSNVINSPTEYHYSGNNGCLEDIFNYHNSLQV